MAGVKKHKPFSQKTDSEKWEYCKEIWLMYEGKAKEVAELNREIENLRAEVQNLNDWIYWNIKAKQIKVTPQMISDN